LDSVGAPVLGRSAAAVPVVLASRTGAGPVLSDTYGAVGSERDLRERGLIGGGYAHPYQARILPRLLVAAARGRTPSPRRSRTWVERTGAMLRARTAPPTRSAW
jgi:L-asparaginase